MLTLLIVVTVGQAASPNKATRAVCSESFTRLDNDKGRKTKDARNGVLDKKVITNIREFMQCGLPQVLEAGRAQQRAQVCQQLRQQHLCKIHMRHVPLPSMNVELLCVSGTPGT